MNADTSEVDNILNQLKSLPSAAPKSRLATKSMDPKELEQFVIDKTAELVNKSMEILDEYRDFLSATPGEDSAEAMANLIGASTTAIETLSKIAISNKKIETSVKIKDMDIQARKEIAKDDNNTRLLLSRQEIMKLIKDSEDPIPAPAIEVDVTPVAESH